MGARVTSAIEIASCYPTPSSDFLSAVSFTPSGLGAKSSAYTQQNLFSYISQVWQRDSRLGNRSNSTLEKRKMTT
jgi:hypothetical protein